MGSVASKENSEEIYGAIDPKIWTGMGWDGVVYHGVMSEGKYMKELCELLASVRSEHEAEMLLTDLLTPAEIRSLTKRWLELQELARGTSQRDVAKKLKVSISKVTRGSRVLKAGTGGAWLFLRRLGKMKQ